MRRRRLMEIRPDYYRGQLLLEDDFRTEQRYHADARWRHNLNLHGWGVVRGLEVLAEGEKSIMVNPGFAIDRLGRDVIVDRAEGLDLAEFEPNDLVEVGLAYEEEPLEKTSADRNRVECYAVLAVSRSLETDSALRLATVRLDEQGRVRSNSIDYSRTRYVRTVPAPGSITAAELSPELRTGWLRMPFRPIALVNKPEGEAEIPPAFRVGATEALSPRPRETGEEDKGAAGTMDLPVPPSARRVIRFRIAGSVNEGEIVFQFVRGGWDPAKHEHLRSVLLDEKISRAPFLQTYELADVALDPEYHTLSLWLRGTRRTSISLIAVEFAY